MGLNFALFWILYSSRLAVEKYFSCLVVDVFNWNPGVDNTHILINNHQRAYLFIAAGKVAWGRLGKPISLNSGFACEIASLNFDSFDQNRKETR